jgi:microcystin-dependent protein
VFIAVVNTNPGTLLGYGTWSAFAAGRMLVGFNAGDADFDTAEETGGAKTVTLTAAQSGLPQHTHTQNAHTHTQNAHNHVITSQTATTGGATSYEHGTLDTSSAEAEATETTANATAVNQDATAVNQNAGPTDAAQAHSNMPPYITVYMWKRTA